MTDAIPRGTLVRRPRGVVIHVADGAGSILCGATTFGSDSTPYPIGSWERDRFAIEASCRSCAVNFKKESPVKLRRFSLAFSFLMLSSAILDAHLARAQASGGFIPPTGASYVVKFTAPTQSVTVAKACLVLVNSTASPVLAIDKNGDSKIDASDALGCSSGTIVADGTTVNSFSVGLSPAPTVDQAVALIAFPPVGDPHPQSGLSNWKVLAAPVRALIILDSENDATGGTFPVADASSAGAPDAS